MKKKDTLKIRGLLGIEVLEGAVNTDETSANTSTVSPLNFRIQNMTIETPNGKKRSLSATEQAARKRLTSDKDDTPRRRSTTELARSLSKHKFDPLSIDQSDIIDID